MILYVSPPQTLALEWKGTIIQWVKSNCETIHFVIQKQFDPLVRFFFFFQNQEHLVQRIREIHHRISSENKNKEWHYSHVLTLTVESTPMKFSIMVTPSDRDRRCRAPPFVRVIMWKLWWLCNPSHLIIAIFATFNLNHRVIYLFIYIFKPISWNLLIQQWWSLDSSCPLWLLTWLQLDQRFRSPYVIVGHPFKTQFIATDLKRLNSSISEKDDFFFNLFYNKCQGRWSSSF